MTTDELLTELLASSKRIEALLVATGAQQFPPGRPRPNTNVDLIEQAVQGAPADEIAAKVAERSTWRKV